MAVVSFICLVVLLAVEGSHGQWNIAGCFSTYEGRMGYPWSGSYPDVTTLEQCKQACLDDDHCISVDWISNQDQHCHLHHGTLVYSAWTWKICTHYIRNPSCRPKWKSKADVHVPGGSSRDAETVEDCKDICLEHPTCVAVDWNNNCRTLNKTGPTQVQSGTTHYDLEPYHKPCWTSTENVQGTGGTPYSASSLKDCQMECLNSDSCVAVDWDGSCRLLSTTAVSTTSSGTHYERNQACRQCWIATEDIHALGGTNHQAGTKPECKKACLLDDNCFGIDWDIYTTYSCWLLWGDAKQDTTEAGVITHYDRNRFCQATTTSSPPPSSSSSTTTTTTTTTTPATTTSSTTTSATTTPGPCDCEENPGCSSCGSVGPACDRCCETEPAGSGSCE